MDSERTLSDGRMLPTDIMTSAVSVVFAVVSFATYGRASLRIGALSVDRGVGIGIVFCLATFIPAVIPRIFRGAERRFLLWFRLFYVQFFYLVFFSEAIQLSNLIYLGQV